MANEKPLALSVEKVRHEMLRGIFIPRELVNKALAKTAAQLEARETKFFAHQGRVTDKREVADHGIQAAAADKIFSLAGLYARERESAPQAPAFALEVDARTGVIRFAMGSQHTEQVALPQPPAIDNQLDIPFDFRTPETEIPPPAPHVPLNDKLWKIVSDEEV